MVRQRRRAQRFLIPLELHYRVPTETDWSAGRIQNISKSGILFGGVCEPLVGAQIEMRLILESNGQRIPADVFARAQVVRVGASNNQHLSVAIGAKFLNYRFVPVQVAKA